MHAQPFGMPNDKRRGRLARSSLPARRALALPAVKYGHHVPGEVWHDPAGPPAPTDQRLLLLGPKPQNIQEVALFLPTVYIVSALLADWLGGKRSPKAVSASESLQPAAQA